MRVFLLIVVLSFTSLAIRMDSASKGQKTIEQLRSTEWGSTILELVSLHSLSGGPVQELIQAIDDLIEDLSQELQQLEQDYSLRTNEHNASVRNLEMDIQQAFIEIQRSTDSVENLLRPRRDQLKKKIATLVEYQAVNRKNLNEIGLIRQQTKVMFEGLASEYNEATDAVDQALTLLQTLSNPSLVEVGTQVRQFHVQLRNVEYKLNPRSRHAPLIRALISLAAEQNFSDQNVTRQIIDKLNEFRVQVVQALNDAQSEEQESISEYEKRVDQLNSEFGDFQRSIINLNIDLTAVIDKLNMLTSLIAQLTEDKNNFTNQLELENSQYAEETQIYKELKDQMLQESAIAEEGHRLVTSVDLSSVKL